MTPYYNDIKSNKILFCTLQFHASVGISPQSVDQIKDEILRQDKMVKKLPLMIRLQQSLAARLDDAKSNVSIS